MGDDVSDAPLRLGVRRFRGVHQPAEWIEIRASV
jgi:hypothetical protein